MVSSCLTQILIASAPLLSFAALGFRSSKRAVRNGDFLAKCSFGRRSRKGHRLDPQQRQSRINQLMAAGSKVLRCPRVEETREDALYFRFFLRECKICGLIGGWRSLDRTLLCGKFPAANSLLNRTGNFNRETGNYFCRSGNFTARIRETTNSPHATLSQASLRRHDPESTGKLVIRLNCA